MPSTEFLLYLVIVIFVIFVIMQYYKNDSHEPEVQYKYIPIYRNEKLSNISSPSSENPGSTSNGVNGQYTYGTNSENNKNLNIEIVNRGEMGHRSGYAPGYGPGYGPGCDPRYRPGPGPEPIPTVPPLPAAPAGPLPHPPHVPPIDPLRKFDYDAVYDDFTPPFRRSYYDESDYRLPPGLYPIYTRYPGRFRKIGTLIAQGVSANDKYKFLSLFGRQKYVGREYEYYAITNTDQKLKFYIDTKGKEIFDGDIVNVSELSEYAYKFKQDEDLSPRYDPWII